MTRPIIGNVTLAATYAALTTSPVVGDVVILNPTGNDTAYLEAVSPWSGDVPVAAGEYYEFKRVNLSTIRAKGTASQTLRIIGNTSYP